MAATTEQVGSYEDLRYEFDAPQFYDFEQPSAGGCNSGWFAGQTGDLFWPGQIQSHWKTPPFCIADLQPIHMLLTGDAQAIQDVCSKDVQEAEASESAPIEQVCSCSNMAHWALCTG